MGRWVTYGTVLVLVVGGGRSASADPERAFDPRVQERPRGTYVRVTPPKHVQGAQRAMFGRGRGPLTLFLNRDGGSYTESWWDDATRNESSVLRYSVDMPPFPYSDRSWDRVMDCVREMYAPFNVTVTDLDPGDEPHLELLVSGSAEDIGQDWRVAGIAPMACEPIDNAVAYAFPEAHGDDPISICETAAQESAHAFGLDHEMLCEDNMTYLWGCEGSKSFVDQDAPCGEYQERGCACGGAEQNSYQYLLSVLGPNEGVNQPPRVSIEAPADGDEVEPGFEIEVDVSDDGGVERAELWIGGEAVDTVDAAPWRLTAPEGLAAGPLIFEVRVYDEEDAEGSDTRQVEVLAGDDDDEVDEPDDDDQLEPDVEIEEGAIGADCEDADDCNSNACVVGEGYCTDRCDESDCPAGFVCDDTSDGAFCLRDGEEDKHRDRGCTAIAGVAPRGTLLWLMAVAAFLLAGRRRC